MLSHLVERRDYLHNQLESYFISGQKETLQDQEIEYKVHILRLLAGQRHNLQLDPSYVPTPVFNERLSQSFYVSSENVVTCVTSYSAYTSIPYLEHQIRSSSRR